MKMYAIPNCNTVKKARTWLEENNISYEFYDYKKQGADESKLHEWVKQFGWETILNTKGMTWRKLSEDERAAINNDEAAIALMMEKPSIIKRPILDNGQAQLVGFKEEEYAEKLA